MEESNQQSVFDSLSGVLRQILRTATPHPLDETSVQEVFLLAYAFLRENVDAAYTTPELSMPIDAFEVNGLDKPHLFEELYWPLELPDSEPIYVHEFGPTDLAHLFSPEKRVFPYLDYETDETDEEEGLIYLRIYLPVTNTAEAVLEALKNRPDCVEALMASAKTISTHWASAPAVRCLMAASSA